MVCSLISRIHAKLPLMTNGSLREMTMATLQAAVMWSWQRLLAPLYVLETRAGLTQVIVTF